MVTVACGGYHSFALDADGALYVTGSNGSGQIGLGAAQGCRTWQRLSLPEEIA